MRKRLLLSYVSVVLAVLVVLEVPLGILADHHERTSLLNQATSTAMSIAVLAGSDLEAHQLDGLETLVQRYHGQAGGDLLVTGPNRELMASSQRHGPDDLGDVRSLVATALQGRNATGWRTDDGREDAVAAVPIQSSANSAAVVGSVVLYLPADPAIDRIHDVWIALALFAVGVLGLTVLVGSALARGVSRPLASLGRAVKRLGAGNLSERAQPAGPAELQALAVEFNRMAAQIEKLVAAQTRFVADASHQLRSPLTALRLRLENLEMALEGDGDRDRPPLAASVAAASREVQRLSRLVDGLLTLSRAEHQEAERQPVAVGDVVANRLEAWKPLADERGVDLRASGPLGTAGSAPLVPGDLDQILDNLLSNALDATGAGGEIVMQVVPSPAGVDVSVVDDGPGMSADERARAFDRFWQGAGHRGGSSGLGLAIVAQLAQRNHATVELQAAQEHGGGRGAGRDAGVAAGGVSGPDTGGLASARETPRGQGGGQRGGRGGGTVPAREAGEAAAGVGGSSPAGSSVLVVPRAGGPGLRATVHLSR